MERILTRRQTLAIGLPPLHRVLQQLRLWQQRMRTRGSWPRSTSANWRTSGSATASAWTS